MDSLYQKLKQWQLQQCKAEGLPEYRVLPNATLYEIARRKPQSKEELLQIKGFKEGRYFKYGKSILAIITGTGQGDLFTANDPFSEANAANELAGLFAEQEEVAVAQNSDEPMNDSVPAKTVDMPLSVGEFLDTVNVTLSGLRAKVRGEVTSVDRRERVVYFSIKDNDGEGVLNCLIFAGNYRISGVDIAVGDEIIVHGTPDIYKPTGRFSLKTDVIELAGEGALAKAYEKLKLKLESEGLFSPERKRPVPEFVQKIGLVTSAKGAAIGDFMMNVGRYGFTIRHYDSRVEGKQAVLDLLNAVKYFNKTGGIDVLVIVRGGGSLESLQAFNNEELVRIIAESPVPVICGIGHEQDETIATLVADAGVSTPTAAARAIRESWDRAADTLVRSQEHIFQTFDTALSERQTLLENAFMVFSERISTLLERFDDMASLFVRMVDRVGHTLERNTATLAQAQSVLVQRFADQLTQHTQRLESYGKLLDVSSPERQLKLGYAIVRSAGSIVRSTKDVSPGDPLSIKVSDGSITTTVKDVQTSEEN